MSVTPPETVRRSISFDPSLTPNPHPTAAGKPSPLPTSITPQQTQRVGVGEAAEPPITCTVVAIESSMRRPSKALGDPLLSPTTHAPVQRVPVLHVFGYTTDYSTCCVHVHGALPYFLVPCYSTSMTPEGFAGQLEAAARRPSAGGPPLVGSNTPLLHFVEVVMGVPFYGFHGTKRPFFKIYLYQPSLVPRLAALLGSTTDVGGRRWQPYEAHIPFVFQFMSDLNLNGMGALPMAGGVFHASSSLPNGVAVVEDDDGGGQDRRLCYPQRRTDPISGASTVGMCPLTLFTISRDTSRPKEALSAVELDTSVDCILKGREQLMGGPPVPGENLSVVRRSLSKVLCDTLHHTKAGAADVLLGAVVDRFAEDRRLVGGSVELTQRAAPLVPHMRDLASSYCAVRMAVSQSQSGSLRDVPVAATPTEEASVMLGTRYCDASDGSLAALLRQRDARGFTQLSSSGLAPSQDNCSLASEEDGAYDFSVCPTFELLDFMREGDEEEDHEPKLTPMAEEDNAEVDEGSMDEEYSDCRPHRSQHRKKIQFESDGATLGVKRGREGEDGHPSDLENALYDLDGFEGVVGGRSLRLVVEPSPDGPIISCTPVVEGPVQEDEEGITFPDESDDESESVARPLTVAEDIAVDEGVLTTQYGAATQRWLEAEDTGGGAVTMSMLMGSGGSRVVSSAPALSAITPRRKVVRRPKFRVTPSQPLNTQQRSCISMLKVLCLEVVAMPPACGKVVHAATSPLLAVGLAYTLSTSDVIEYKQMCVWPDCSPGGYHNGNGTWVYPTERQLFAALVSEVRAADPDIIMSWDVDKYGFGYLVERGRLSSRVDLLQSMGRIPPEGLDAEGELLGGGSGSGGEFTRVSWGVGTMRRDAARSEPPPLQRREGVVTLKVPGRIVIPLRKCAKSELKQKSYTFQAVFEALFNRPCPLFQDDLLAAMYASGVSGVTVDSMTPLKRDRSDAGAQPAYFMTGRAPLALQYLQLQVVGTLRIAKAMDLYVRTSEMAQLYGILFFEVLSRGSQFKVESFLQRFAKPRNFVLVSPSRQQVMLANQQEGIPLVMEPHSGLYTDPVVVLDFRSLYPSIVIAYNLCYSTCLGKVSRNSHVQIGSLRNYRLNDAFLSTTLSTDEVVFAPNSCMFVKKKVREGVLPAMLESILNTRFQVQKVIKGAGEQGEEDLGRVLDAQQLALKMLANVTYGYTAATFSGRMPCTDLADAIVLLGRQTLERAIRTVEGNAAWNAKVVYGDTDSLFIQLPGRTRMEAFDVAEEMVRAVNAANPDPVTLKFEKVYHPCFMVVKKRYVGYAYEHRGQTVPKFDAKGIETVRRDQCEATSKICEELIRTLFEGVVKNGRAAVVPPSQGASLLHTAVEVNEPVVNVDADDVRHRGGWKALTVRLRRYFYEQANKIQRGDAHPSDYIIRREVKLGTYSRESTLPPAARVAVQRIEADAGDCPAYGDRVPYVVLCPTSGDRLKDMVADPFTLLRRNVIAAVSASTTPRGWFPLASGDVPPSEAPVCEGDFLTRVGARGMQPSSPDGGVALLRALYGGAASCSHPQPPAYFMLNGDHYLRKHIIPSLNRLFHMVGVDFEKWYEVMPKAASSNEASLLFHHYFNPPGGLGGDRFVKSEGPSRRISSSTSLDQFYLSTKCVVCNDRRSSSRRTSRADDNDVLELSGSSEDEIHNPFAPGVRLNKQFGVTPSAPKAATSPLPPVCAGCLSHTGRSDALFAISTRRLHLDRRYMELLTRCHNCISSNQGDVALSRAEQADALTREAEEDDGNSSSLKRRVIRRLRQPLPFPFRSTQPNGNPRCGGDASVADVEDLCLSIDCPTTFEKQRIRALRRHVAAVEAFLESDVQVGDALRGLDGKGDAPGRGPPHKGGGDVIILD